MNVDLKAVRSRLFFFMRPLCINYQSTLNLYLEFLLFPDDSQFETIIAHYSSTIWSRQGQWTNYSSSKIAVNQVMEASIRLHFCSNRMLSSPWKSSYRREVPSILCKIYLLAVSSKNAAERAMFVLLNVLGSISLYILSSYMLWYIQ